MADENDAIFRSLDSADVGITLEPEESKKGISLNFYRSRAVRFDWAAVLSGKSPPYSYPSDDFSYCRKLFETSWGYPTNSPTAAELGSLPGPRLFSVDHDDARNTVFIAYGVGPDQLPRTNVLLPANTPRVELTRCFAVDAKPGKTIDLQSFSTDAKYASFWDDALRFRMPNGVEAEAIGIWQTITSVEVLDLSADQILTRYRQLNSARTLATELAASASKLLSVPDGKGLDVEGVGDLFSQYLAMTDPKEEVQGRLRDLQQAAKDKGYVLAIDDGTTVIPGAGGTPIVLKAGELLQRTRDTANIEIGFNRTTLTLTEAPKFIDDGLIQASLGYLQSASSLTEEINLKVTGNDALIAATEARLQISKIKSFYFDLEGNEYKTNKGELLEDILDRCDRDDYFRRGSAIWIPLYIQSITKKRQKSAYMVIRGPLPGITPCRLPQLFIDEEAALELSWTGAKLGELATSVALAPGEERTITLEQTVSRSREETTSDEQVLESDQTFSSEFATEVERESKNTVNMSTSTNWSASAEGSASFFDIFSAGGSASGGQTWTKTAEDFYRTLAKSGSKSASSLSNKARREVSTSSTTRIEEQRVEKTSMTLTNINDGRALSVLLYHLSNIYAQVPLVRDLRLVSIPSVPRIEGIILRWPNVYHRSEVDKAISDLVLPSPSFVAGDMTKFKSLARYFDQWIQSVHDLIVAEYTIGASTSPAAILTPMAAVSFAGGATDDEGEVAKRLKELVKQLSAVTKPGDKLHLEFLEITTPALFADCVVGAMRGTEPYSESMRQREVRGRDAQIALTLSSALLQTAQARRAGQGKINEVDNIKRSDDLKSIVFTTKSPPTEGRWLLYVDGTQEGKLDVSSAISATKKMEFSFKVAQPWITEDESNLALMLHQTTNETITVLV